MSITTVKLALLLAAVLLAATTTGAKWKKPDFCGNFDCPPFASENKTDDYEVRTYKGGFWAVATVAGSKYELAYTKAAAKLLRYFNGANGANERLERTTPTLAALKLEKDSQGSERNYSFSMWLPRDYQEEEETELPQPNDEAVEIVDFPETTVFVRVFGGFATEASILQEATKLHEVLEKDGKDFEKELVFVAVYDPAVKLFNRHNEVHVLSGGSAPGADRSHPGQAAAVS